MKLNALYKNIDNEDIEGFKQNLNAQDLDTKKALYSTPVFDQPLVEYLYQSNLPEFAYELIHSLGNEYNFLSDSTHPIYFALEHHDDKVVQYFLNNPTLCLGFKDLVFPGNNNLLHASHQVDNTNYIQAFIDLGVSPFELNVQNQSAVDLSIYHNHSPAVFPLYLALPEMDNHFGVEYLSSLAFKNDMSSLQACFDTYDITRDEYVSIFDAAVDGHHIKPAAHVLRHCFITYSKAQLDGMINCVASSSPDDASDIDLIFEKLMDVNYPLDKAKVNGQSIWNVFLKANNNHALRKGLALIDSLDHESFSVSDNPLSHAILHKNIEAIHLLRGKGLTMNHVDSRRHTPLIRAVITKDPKVVDAILSYGEQDNLNFNQKNDHRFSALDIAIRQSNVEIVSALLWNKVSVFSLHNYPSVVSGDENAALRRAVLNKFNPLKPLTIRGFDPNQDNGKQHLLSFLIEKNLPENVSALLKLSVNPNLADPIDGNTALHHALRSPSIGHLLALDFHKGNFLDFSIQNHAGQTPIDVLLEADNKQTIMYLSDCRLRIPFEEKVKLLPSLLQELDVYDVLSSYKRHVPELLKHKLEDGSSLKDIAEIKGDEKAIEWIRTHSDLLTQSPAFKF